MQIILTHQESEEYFYNALCNGLGEMSGYGLELECKENDYNQAKSKLSNPCYEDVLMQILRDGNTLTMIDNENDDENEKDYWDITLEDVHNKVQNTPLQHLQAMIDEQDDAITADVILQTVFFDEIVFG